MISLISTDEVKIHNKEQQFHVCKEMKHTTKKEKGTTKIKQHPQASKNNITRVYSALEKEQWSPTMLIVVGSYYDMYTNSSPHLCNIITSNTS